jgi:pimeloyl-ACP methyl ester carboxylesterase
VRVFIGILFLSFCNFGLAQSQAGKTRTWVLLRGLARESQHWGGFLPMFRAAFPKDRIVTPDFPGIGARYDERSPRSIRELRLAVATELKQQGYAPPYSLVALSLGGMVALEWVQSEPQEIDFFAISSTSDARSNPARRLRARLWPHILAMGTARTVEEKERRILSWTVNSIERRTKVLPDYVAIATARPLKPATFASQLLAATRFRARDAVLSPGFFIVGAQDHLVDPRCTTLLGRLFEREVITHPWGGHDLSVDDPQWLLNTIVERVGEEP